MTAPEVITTSVGKVQVDKEPGFVAVSLSKLVEISSRDISMICIDGSEYELDLLDTVFSPEPRDGYLKVIVDDIINDVSTGVDGLFEINKEMFGDQACKVSKDDWSLWCNSYRDELVKNIAKIIKNIEGDDIVSDVLIMPRAVDLVFIILASFDNVLDIALDDEEVLDDDDEFIPDEED